MNWLKTIKHFIIFILTAVLMCSCLEPFEADVSASQLDVLIIDGYINVGPGETRITLSKVSGLDQADKVRYEEDAEVFIQNNSGEGFLLNESEDGLYTSGELNLPADKQYRLYIILSNGKEFHSELQSPKITPVIDSIHWEFRPDLLYIYAKAHDATGATRYYGWKYREDWQVKSPFKADLMYTGFGRIEERPDPWMLPMHNCWKKLESKQIVFSSTTLQQDDYINFPVVTIPHNSEKTAVKYSVIIEQHTITEDEFNYLTLMNKNSTQTGSFFDPMPSQLFGNIKRIDNPKETVIGYVGVYTTQKDTLFILKAELPADNGFQINCPTIEFTKTIENCDTYLGGNPPPYIPYQQYSPSGDPADLIVVAMVTKDCMDCRSNATGPRPDFWYPNGAPDDEDEP